MCAEKMEILKTCALLNKKGEKVDLATDTPLALYFSGHFCAPCLTFTPLLKDFYEEVNEDDKKIEIIFVSLDKTVEEQEAYHKEHGDWPRIAFSNESERQALKSLMGVEKIPALIVLDDSKKAAKYTDGVNDVRNMGPMALDLKWTAC